MKSNFLDNNFVNNRYFHVHIDEDVLAKTFIVSDEIGIVLLVSVEPKNLLRTRSG